MGSPFLDRFGISVPISMPSTTDLQLILNGKDEKYSGRDELLEVPSILNLDELMEIWYYVNRITSSESVNHYIHAIIREYTLCARIDKGNTEDLKPSTGLCSGCHFNTAQNICNKVDSILSVRAAKDFLRYSKALTWLMNLEEISIDIVNSIAPYVISHRVIYSKREMEKAPFWGNKYEFSKDMIMSLQKRYLNREKCYQIVGRFSEGVATDSDFAELKKYESNDLIVKYDLLPFANNLKNKSYSNIIKDINEAAKKGMLEELSKIRESLIENNEFPNCAYLINKCDQELFKQTVTDYVFKYKNSKELWADIVAEFPELNMLKDLFDHRQTKQIRTKDLLIELNVTGTDDDSLVNLQFSGGSDALKLRSILDG
ncbi:MAG: hypothetical protein ACFFKA_17090, partial [Candidatus Thorarchaeota archaeon]